MADAEQTLLQSAVHRFSRKGTSSLSQPQIYSLMSFDLDFFESLRDRNSRTLRVRDLSQAFALPVFFCVNRDVQKHPETPQTASSPVLRVDGGHCSARMVLFPAAKRALPTAPAAWPTQPPLKTPPTTHTVLCLSCWCFPSDRHGGLVVKSKSNSLSYCSEYRETGPLLI